jgi:hypothetical protein
MTVAGQAIAGETYAATISALRPWATGGERRTPSKLPRDDVAKCPNLAARDADARYGNLDAVRIDGATDALNADVTVKKSDHLVLEGWAADLGADYHGRALCVIVDGRGGFAATGTHHGIRIDAVESELRPEITTSGFRVTVDPSTFGVGTTVSI